MQINLLIKQKQTFRLRELTYGCWGEGREEETVREFGRVHTAIFKMDSQQGPTV